MFVLPGLYFNILFSFLNQLFYVTSASWVISDNRRRDFLYVVADLDVFQIL